MLRYLLIQTIFSLAFIAVSAQNYIVPAERDYLKNELPDPITSFAPTRARLEELSNMLTVKPVGISYKITNRKIWDEIGKNESFASVVTDAEKALTDSKAKIKLNTLVYAECIENKGRFIELIESKIHEICEQETWVKWNHDIEKSNRTGTEITADLVSTEIAAELGTIYYWLGENLPVETRKLIKTELKIRIFDPVRKHAQGVYHGGMFWMWRTNNWNGVCWSNIVIAAMSVLESPYERAFFLGAAENSLTYFIDSFFDDGYCQEGLGYWNYGFSFYVRFADLVYKVTEGELDYLNNEKVFKIALFGLRNQIQDDVYTTLADCKQYQKPSAGLQNYVSKKYELNAKNWETPLGVKAAEPKKIIDFVWYFPSGLGKTYGNAFEYSFDSYRDWYPNGQMLICRPGTFSNVKLSVAMKGGDNIAPHNHNDVGSFMVSVNGKVPITDPGPASYRRGKAFLADRYASKILSSYGHNVPVVDWHLQIAGKEAEAIVLEESFSDEKDILRLDLRNAYKIATLPLNGNYNVQSLLKLERTFIYSRKGEGSFTIIDEADFTQASAFETALMTIGEYNVQKDGSIVINENGESLKVVIDAGGLAYEIVKDEIKEAMGGGSENPTRIGIRLKELTKEVKLKITIVAL